MTNWSDKPSKDHMSTLPKLSTLFVRQLSSTLFAREALKSVRIPSPDRVVYQLVCHECYLIFSCVQNNNLIPRLGKLRRELRDVLSRIYICIWTSQQLFLFLCHQLFCYCFRSLIEKCQTSDEIMHPRLIIHFWFVHFFTCPYGLWFVAVRGYEFISSGELILQAGKDFYVYCKMENFVDVPFHG